MAVMNVVACPKCHSRDMSESRFFEFIDASDVDPIETPFPPPDSAWMHVCAKCGKKLLLPA